MDNGASIGKLYLIGFVLGLGLSCISSAIRAQPNVPALDTNPVVISKSGENQKIRLEVNSYNYRSKKLGEPAPDGKVFFVLRGTLINKSSVNKTAVPEVQAVFLLQLADNKTAPLHSLSRFTDDPFWGFINLEPGEELPVEMVFAVPSQQLTQVSLAHQSAEGDIQLAVIGRLVAASPSTLPAPVGESPEREVNLWDPDAPFARFAYVANFDDHTISAYTVDNETGALRHNGYLFSRSRGGPFWIAPDPKGRFLFVANIENESIEAYKINQRTGSLDFSAAIAVEEYPSAIAVNATGKFLYVTNEQSEKVSVYVINQMTGNLRLGRTLCTGKAPSSVTIDPQERFLYVMNRVGKTVSLYKIDPRYGSISTPEGQCGEQIPAGETPISMAIDPEGTFAYVADTRSNVVYVYSVDPISGMLERVGEPVPAGIGPVWIAMHPSGQFAYVANLNSNDIFIYRVLHTGGLAYQTKIDAEAGPQSIVIDPRGRSAYVTNRDSNHVSVYRIDRKSGMLAYSSSVTARSWPRSLALVSGEEPLRQTPKFVYVWGYDTQVAGFSLETSDQIEEILDSPFRIKNGHVAVHPSGRFAYRLQKDSVSTYILDWLTGDVVFERRTPFNTSNFTGVSLTVDPSGRWAYVTGHQFDPRNEAKSVVFVFAINPDTGHLSASDEPTLVLRTRDMGPVLVDPAGKFAFVTLWKEAGPHLLAMYPIDAGFGSLSREPTSSGHRGYRVCGFHPGGSYVYAVRKPDTLSVFRIEGEAGHLSHLQDLKGGEYPWCLAIHPSGEFAYAIDSTRSTIVVHKIDQSTGRLIGESSSIKTRSRPVSVTIDPTGQFASVLYDGAGELLVYRVNRDTGALSSTGSRLITGFEPDTVTFRVGQKTSGPQ